MLSDWVALIVAIGLSGPTDTLKVYKNARGEIARMSLYDASDNQLQSIDFEAFPALESVAILSRYVTNRGLSRLERAPAGLKTLIIDGSWIDDKGIVPVLRRHKDLTLLILRNTRVGDGSLREIQQLRDLITLCLDGTRITDAGLEHLETLSELRILNLSGTAVSDAGMRTLSKIKELGTLDLSYTKVTDQGTRQLAVLQRLHTLRLDGTKVTGQGKAALKNALPDLNFR